MAERPRAAQVLVAATGFLALFAIVGFALYGLPLFYNFWVTEFGWSRKQVTSGNAFSKLLIGPLFGFAAGWLIDRFGPRRLMLAGILMAGGAVIGLGSMSALWMFYLFYIFNALGYVCGGPLPIQVLLSRWFTKARGSAMGFAYLGIGIGGAIVPLLTIWLTERFGWRGALQTIGVLMLVIAFPAAFFVKESPDGRKKATEVAAMVPVREVFRNKAFYLLAIGSMCSIGAVGGTIQHLKLFLTLDMKYPEPSALTISFLVLLFSIGGRLLMGVLSDFVPKKHVMLLIYFLVAAAIPLQFLGASKVAMYAFAAIFGLGLGGEYLIIPLIAGELFGQKVLGRILGIIVTADGVAEAAFPYLVGHLYDRNGNYKAGFVTLICVALLGALAVGLLPRKSSTSGPDTTSIAAAA
jgi:sugar phosphate permease